MAIKHTLQQTDAAADDAAPVAAAQPEAPLEHAVARLEAQVVRHVRRAGRYRALVEGSAHGIVVQDRGAVLYANPRAAELLGYATPDDLVALDEPGALVEPADRPRVFAQIEALLDGARESDTWEHRVHRRDGASVTVHISARTIEWDGRRALHCTLLDVTEARRLSAALAASEARLQAIVDSAPFKIVIKDTGGRFISVNRAMERAIGRPAADLIGRSARDLFPVEVAERFEREDATVLSERRVVYVESDIPHPDGTVRHEATTRFPITDGNGALIGIGLISADISDRREAREALRESEERFRNLVEGSVLGILIHRDWKPLFVNAAYASLLGYDSPDELLAKPTIEEHVAPQDRERRLCYMRARLRGEPAPDVYEFGAVRSDGTVLRLQNSARVVNWLGEPAIQSTVVDVTERAAAEEALRQSEIRFRDFADAAGDWFWETDEAMRFTYLSDRFADLTGLDPRRFLGHHRRDIAMEDAEVGKWAAHRADLDARQPFRDFTYWMRDDDGRRRHFRINGIPVFDGAGTFRGYRGTGIEITERVLADERVRTAERRLVDAFQSLSDGAALFDAEDRLVACNDAWRHDYAALVSDLCTPGTTFEEIVRGMVERGGLDGFEGREDEFITARLERHRDPRGAFEISSLGRTFRIQEQRAPDGATFLVVSDIGDLKRREMALRESEQRFRDFAETAADWFFETDDQLRYTYVSERHQHLTGWMPEEVLGRTHRSLYSETIEDNDVLARHFEDLEAHRPYEVELASRRADGSRCVLRYSAKPVHDENGVFRGYRGTGRDVTEARRIAERMAHQAAHDALTGLVNRQEFERRLDRLLVTGADANGVHAMCYIDLDQFKVVNDTCGHVAGDELLRQLAGVLGERVRRRDTLARLGGDEFAILMEHCPPRQAARVADEVLGAIGDYRFAWEGRTFRLGASIGLVPIPEAGETAAQVLRAADSACYVAKDEGRNRVHLYRPDDVELARRHGEMQWVSKIHTALDEERLCLFGQPIVPLADALAGLPDDAPHRFVELLVRMRDPDAGLVLPGAFLPAAERYNLASRLDRWVVGRAFDWLRAQPGTAEGPIRCSINLSGQSLSETVFLDYVVEKLDASGLDPGRVCFEITETSAIANLARAIRFMHVLKGLGCRFALDDFGSGLSSFAYLKSLPVDFLKIDGTFVKDIATDDIDYAMVRSINDIGRVMGKRTIAEYVEDEAVLARLADIGVDHVQGYHVGRPAPLDP